MDIELGRCLKCLTWAHSRPSGPTYSFQRNRQEKIRCTASNEDWILVKALSNSLSHIPTYPTDHFLPRRIFRKDSAFNVTRIRWIQFIARTEILYFSSVEVELRVYIKSSGPNGRSGSLPTDADVWLNRKSTCLITTPNRWVLRTWGIGDLENLKRW